jgi:hypothetical protein
MQRQLVAAKVMVWLLNSCQSGNAANGFWPVVAYRTESTLATAFGWGNVQWIIFTIQPITNSAGTVVGLAMIEYPPLHRW